MPATSPLPPTLLASPQEVATALERAEGLSDPQRRLLHEMVAVNPEERRSLREVLAKSFFRAGEDTEQVMIAPPPSPLRPSGVM